jgi:hypothetical protein
MKRKGEIRNGQNGRKMKRMSGQQRSEKEENIEGLNLSIENKEKEKEDNMCNG